MARYVHKNALTYSLLTFSFGLLTSIFNFYYVKLFLKVYGISQYWFDIAQILYLVWNAFNDPLFAYWQDNSKIEIFRDRKKSILYGAPLFALSFLLPWFPWGNYDNNRWLAGVHLFVSMACYDALYTFTMLADCALYAEISRKHEDRLRLTKYAQVAAMISSCSVMLAELACDGLENMKAFQIYVVILAIISCSGMIYVAKNITSSEDYRTPSIPYSRGDSSSNASTFSQFKQIITRKNFVIFVTINFLQIFHNFYLHNFLAIFAEELIPFKHMPGFVKKALYGGSDMIIPVLVLCLSPLVASRGYYRVILWSFYGKVALGFIMYLLGYSWAFLLVVFFLWDRGISSAIFKFFNLPVSDIIDEDQREYKRSHPLSSSVFGYNALFTKPAQSLAPMMIVAILERNNYQDRLADDMTESQASDLKAAMFTVACGIPVIVGLLQILVWKPFSIRDSHSAKKKSSASD